MIGWLIEGSPEKPTNTLGRWWQNRPQFIFPKRTRLMWNPLRIDILNGNLICKWRIFQQAMFDYQRVIGDIYYQPLKQTFAEPQNVDGLSSLFPVKIAILEGIYIYISHFQTYPNAWKLEPNDNWETTQFGRFTWMLAICQAGWSPKCVNRCPEGQQFPQDHKPIPDSYPNILKHISSYFYSILSPWFLCVTQLNS